jgi:hypothetical protein
MPLTPQITLTATLEDISGVAAGTTANPAKLVIDLCGYGLSIPEIPGTCVITQLHSELLSTGAQISVKLWGNDVISPGPNVTFYQITVVDGDGNTVQTQCYRFTGAGTIDLSDAVPIVFVPAGPFVLAYVRCTGAIPGATYIAPGSIVMGFVNGAPQRPTIDFNGVGTAVMNLTYNTVAGDSVYALCLVPTGTTNLAYLPCTGNVPGSVYIAPGPVVMAFINGLPQRSPIDFSGVGTPQILFNFNTGIGDQVYALCMV